MKSVFIHGKTWFDKSYGNSYFSARVFVDGNEVARLPFQYGYGDHYIEMAQKKLGELGLLTNSRMTSLRRVLEQDAAVLYTVLEQSRKRDVEGWGKPWTTD